MNFCVRQVFSREGFFWRDWTNRKIDLCKQWAMLLPVEVSIQFIFWLMSISLGRVGNFSAWSREMTPWVLHIMPEICLVSDSVVFWIQGEIVKWIWYAGWNHGNKWTSGYKRCVGIQESGWNASVSSGTRSDSHPRSQDTRFAHCVERRMPHTFPWISSKFIVL